MKFYRTALLALAGAALLAAGPVLALDKDVLTIVKSAEIISLDPQDITDTPSEDLNRKIYEGLVDFNMSLDVVPKLAKSWEISEDRLTWTFKLREGVTFHSGAPFNAEAVKVNFDRILNGRYKRTSLYQPIIKEVRVVDEYAVAFDLKQPFGPFLNNLAHTAGLILDPSYVKDPAKNAKIKRQPSGTGPFKFEEWEPGDYVKMSAFEDYWQGKPKLSGLIYKFAPEASTRAMLVETGEAHVAQAVDTNDVERLKTRDDVEMRIFPNITVYTLVVNTSDAILGDVRVRRALSHSIDRQGICDKILHGNAVPAYRIISPMINCAAGQNNMIAYDPELSKKLLAEAGWDKIGEDGIRMNAEGKRLSVELWTSSKSAIIPEAYIGFARAVGMEIKLQAMDWATLNSRIELPEKKNKAQIFMMGWSPSTGDADWVYRPLLASWLVPPTGQNQSFYRNEIVDQGIRDGMRESDNALRKAAYEKIEEQLIADQPRIPIYSIKNLYAVRREVKNLDIYPINFVMVNHLTCVE
ncbi:ABC transporter, substrate-binding protein, family 5 [Pyramidobacter piscolens W5455]|uniref:ABC transporter, substrate-binding protein, family 5 n=1 Tax=Pyramidobacter piscolens W5455 TaxID=352165 RepID=A0ABM9ZXM3_9BACT|nr:ABC transporter substrate-binding protein [Pyramidobacter piscolens]EFB91716.1 ABC transporter, substrate-binding protein, family 5 [Pyramidobacter piscolens W5455]